MFFKLFHPHRAREKPQPDVVFQAASVLQGRNAQPTREFAPLLEAVGLPYHPSAVKIKPARQLTPLANQLHFHPLRGLQLAHQTDQLVRNLWLNECETSGLFPRPSRKQASSGLELPGSQAVSLGACFVDQLILAHKHMRVYGMKSFGCDCGISR